MFQKKNLSGWLRTQLSSTNTRKRTRGSQIRAGRKLLLESLERREVFDAGWATLLPSTYIGSMNGDSAGNHYVSGNFTTAATFGNFTLPANASGTSDIYLAKQNPNGQFLWAVRVGNPSSNDYSGASAIDLSGNVFLTGDFTGTAQFGSISLTSAGDKDGFLAKFNGSTGEILWARQIGGSGKDHISTPAVDPSGNVVVTGGLGIVAPNNLMEAPELFVTKMSTDGELIWTRTVSGEMAASMSVGAIDSQGSIYTGGRFQGTANFTTGSISSSAYLPNPNGMLASDGLISKLDQNGNWLWARSLAGDTFTSAGFMTIGPNEQLNVSGQFQGTVQFDGIALSSAGNSDAYVTQVNANTGAVNWAIRMGGSGADGGGVGVGYPQGNLTVYGSFRGTADFGQHTLVAEGTYSNAFLVKLSNSGEVLEAHRVVTGASQISSNGLHYDAAGNGYIAGSSFGSSAQTPQQPLVGAGGFIIKLPPAAPTKFYVVDDSTRDRTYQYANTGELTIDHFSMNTGNTAPRGAASNAAGTTVWVADKNRNVYVYNNSGTSQGSWTASSLSSTAQVEGVATNGADVWIVDNSTDKVFRHTGAASRVSGSQSAASSFKLNSANSNPKGIVTDGVSIWVVNDSTTDKIFKYTVGGSYLGSWTIDSANKSPTGLTIDPTNGSQDIWVVDNGTDKIYQYANSRSRTSGSQGTLATYALAVGNTNPQGIADPPPPSTTLTTSHAISQDKDVAMTTAVVGVSVGSVLMPSTGAPSSNVIFERSHRRESTVRNTDDIMSNLGRTSPMPQATGSIIRKAPVASQPVDPSESDAFEIEDDEISDLIGLVANNLWS